MSRAEQAIIAAQSAGVRVSVAESLTGGLVSAALTDVPGSSAVFPGSVVTYESEAKARILGVSAELLAAAGPVDPTVARQMAQGVARLFGAEIAVATTGVAGPEPHGGHPPGVVFVGWFAQGETGAQEGRITGDRAQVRRVAVDAALGAITQCVLFGLLRDDLFTPPGQSLRRE